MNTTHASQGSLSPSDRSLSPHDGPHPQDIAHLRNECETLEKRVHDLSTQAQAMSDTHKKFADLLHRSHAVHDRYKSTYNAMPPYVKGAASIKVRPPGRS